MPGYLDLKDDGGLGRVALSVDRNVAGDGFEVRGGRERIAHFWAVGGTRPLDGVGQNDGGIITTRRERIGVLAIPTLAIIFDKLLTHFAANLWRIMRREVMPFDCVLTDLSEFFRFPTVAAEQRNFQAES